MKKQKIEWRQATLATKLAHRHEHSGWDVPVSRTQRPVPQVKRVHFADIAFRAIYALAIVIALVWALREVFHG